MRPLEADGITVPSVLNTHWGSAYPTERVERRFILGDPPATTDFRQVASPLTVDMLRPSATGRGIVQFNSLLADEDFIRLAEWMRGYPEMTLRAYGSYDRSISDFEFLRFFPSLRRFDADALHASITSIDGLRHLPDDLEELALGDTTPRHDLSIIGRFPAPAIAVGRGAQEGHRGDRAAHGARAAEHPLDHAARPLAVPASALAAVSRDQARRHDRPSPPAGDRGDPVPRAVAHPRVGRHRRDRPDGFAAIRLPSGAQARRATARLRRRTEFCAGSTSKR